MTGHPQGKLTLKVDGKDYTLFMSMSVLADLQASYGQDVLEKLEKPAGAKGSWMPDLNIVRDLFLLSLKRYHGDQADRWLVDDIIAQNGNAFDLLMGASTPDASAETALGNVERPDAAA